MNEQDINAIHATAWCECIWQDRDLFGLLECTEPVAAYVWPPDREPGPLPFCDKHALRFVEHGHIIEVPATT